MSLTHLGLIGLGSIGRRHLRLLKALRPQIEVTLVRSGQGAHWPEEALATRVVGSLEQALASGIQGAIIASPAPLHIPQALALLRHGLPLLIEKPLATNLNRVDQLQSLTNQQQATILMGYTLRYSPAAQQFRQFLSTGDLGNLLAAQIDCGSYLPSWRPEQDYRQSVSARADLGGGVLLELSHELDYAQWFFGPLTLVGAVLRNSGTLGIEVEDTADLLLQGRDGLPVAIHLDFCSRQPRRRCILQGQHGRLEWDAMTHQVTWSPARGEPEQWSFPQDRDTPYRAQLAHFLACIEQGAAPLVTLEDGIAALALVEAARCADQQHRQIAS
ncbi:MAG: Gfo/Idh/MocA family oxidoreductase [Chromatiaceae bacterium]|nr:Gfo/Idh/MocA family oxidoreductase [Chromatiaceae bacterium]